jgi:hypothetical protein
MIFREAQSKLDKELVITYMFLPLNMVNMHQVVRKQTQRNLNAIENLEEGFQCLVIIKYMQS